MTKTSSVFEFLVGYARRRPATAIAVVLVVAAITVAVVRAIQ